MDRETDRHPRCHSKCHTNTLRRVKKSSKFRPFIPKRLTKSYALGSDMPTLSHHLSNASHDPRLGLHSNVQSRDFHSLQIWPGITCVVKQCHRYQVHKLTDKWAAVKDVTRTCQSRQSTTLFETQATEDRKCNSLTNVNDTLKAKTTVNDYVINDTNTSLLADMSIFTA